MNSHYQNNVLNFTANPINGSYDKVTNKIADLCISHQEDKKWILVIDNEEHAISALTKKSNIDQSKILHINSRKVRINASNIETALAKGNCSAVVVNDNNFKQEQLSHLSKCALASNTTFMVFDKVSGMH